MKLTVAKKMILLTAMVAFGFVGLSINSYIQSNKIFKDASYAAVNSVPSYQVLINVMQGMAAYRANVLFHVINQEPAAMAEIETKISAAKNKIATHLKAYVTDGCGGVSCLSNDEEKLLIAEVTAKFNALEQPFQHVLAFSRQNQFKEAEYTLRNEFFPAFDALTKTIQADIDFNARLAKEATTTAEATKSSAASISLIATLLIVMAIAAFCWVFARNLLKQLGGEPEDLANLAESFANGDIQKNIVINDTDKTSIARSIKTLQSTLGGFVQNIQHMSAEHDAGDIDVTMDEAKFKGAYQEMAAGVNKMVGGHIAMNKKAIAVVQAFGEGNLNASLEPLPGKKAFVNQAIEEVRGNLKTVIADMSHMSAEHDKGDIDVTMDEAKFKGAYQEMAAGVNKMVGGHIAMNKKAIAVVQAFGEGNFEIPLEQFPGKKVFINQAIEEVRSNLKELVQDTDMLSQASAEGRGLYAQMLTATKVTLKRSWKALMPL